MRKQGDVSIPTVILTYGFRNLFRNEKGLWTIFLYAEPALWRFDSVVMSYRLGNRHVTSSA